MTKNKYCNPKAKNKKIGCFDLNQLKKMTQYTDISVNNKSAKDLYKERLNYLQSTSEIDDYSKTIKVKGFKFLGTSANDWNHEIVPDFCINDVLCKLDLKELLSKGITRIAAVFNLDNHTHGGSHWVCVLSDLNEGGIYFICSYGSKPKKEVLELVNKITHMGNVLLLDNNHKLNNLHKTVIKKFSKTGNSSIRIIQSNKGVYRPIQKDNLVYGYTRDGNLDYLGKVESVNGNSVKMSFTIPNNITHFEISGFKYFYNTRHIQKGSNLCGVYCMFFTECFANGYSFPQLMKMELDNDMLMHYLKG